MPMNNAVRYASCLCVVGALAGGSAQSDRRSPTVTSICALERQHAQLQGRRVRIKAVFITDVLEHSTLMDERCPSVKMDLLPTANTPPDESVRQFEIAIHKSLWDPVPGVFAVDISAEFLWRAEAQPHGAVRMTKVWHLKRLPDIPQAIRR